MHDGVVTDDWYSDLEDFCARTKVPYSLAPEYQSMSPDEDAVYRSLLGWQRDGKTAWHNSDLE